MSAPLQWSIRPSYVGSDLHHITSPNDDHVAVVPSLVNARLIAAAPDLLAACQAQHKAIDYLLARLITLDDSFRPTQCAEAWPAAVAGNAAIQKATQP